VLGILAGPWSLLERSPGCRLRNFPPGGLTHETVANKLYITKDDKIAAALFGEPVFLRPRNIPALVLPILALSGAAWGNEPTERLI
jgi:hypothetical protein